MLTARHLMHQPVLTIQPTESVAEAVRLMQLQRVSSLLVTPRYPGEEYGIITKADVVAKVVARGRDPHRVRVAEVMTRPLHVIPPDCSMQDCANLMMSLRIRRLPVVGDDGHPIGIVSDSDVFHAMLSGG